MNMKVKTFFAMVLSALLLIQLPIVVFASSLPEPEVFPDEAAGTAELINTGTTEDAVWTYEATANSGYGFEVWEFGTITNQEDVTNNGANPNYSYQPYNDNPFTPTNEQLSGISKVIALFIPISEPEEEEEPAPAPTVEYKEPEPQEEPAIPDSVAMINTDAGNALPTTELGTADVPTKTISLSLYKVTPAQFTNAVKNVVEKAAPNGAVVIATDKEACLNRAMIEALAKRPDVAMNIVFTRNGKKLRITIPAGYNVLELLDANGYCGYQYLESLFGASTIG